MADSLARRQPGQLAPPKPLSNESRIVVALAEMAMKRNGEWSQETLEIFAAGLSKEPLEDVLTTIDAIGNRTRRERESAVPDFGYLRQTVRSLRHPQRHLREIITKLARIFEATADEELFDLYQETAGHRTDGDMDAAYKALREDETLRKMPTPGRFLSACGIPKVYRDGSKPE